MYKRVLKSSRPVKWKIFNERLDYLNLLLLNKTKSNVKGLLITPISKITGKSIKERLTGQVREKGTKKIRKQKINVKYL